LSAGELRAIASEIDGFSFDVATVALAGWPSNLLLIGRRVEPGTKLQARKGHWAR
jgi:hypothetical protein